MIVCSSISKTEAIGFKSEAICFFKFASSPNLPFCKLIELNLSVTMIAAILEIVNVLFWLEVWWEYSLLPLGYGSLISPQICRTVVILFKRLFKRRMKAWIDN